MLSNSKAMETVTKTNCLWAFSSLSQSHHSCLSSDNCLFTMGTLKSGISGMMSLFDALSLHFKLGTGWINESPKRRKKDTLIHPVPKNRKETTTSEVTLPNSKVKQYVFLCGYNLVFWLYWNCIEYFLASVKSKWRQKTSEICEKRREVYYYTKVVHSSFRKQGERGAHERLKQRSASIARATTRAAFGLLSLSSYQSHHGGHWFSMSSLMTWNQMCKICILHALQIHSKPKSDLTK